MVPRALRVRPAELPREREAFLRVLERNLPVLDHRRRFDWMYLRNPVGRAWSWMVEDEGTGQVAGVASVFPRLVWLAGRLCRCGQVGDFAVDRGYRTLGPAVALQRATLGPVDVGELAFCYDCPPHERGMAPFRRLGLQARTRMMRYARPLRVDRYVRRRLTGSAGRLASWLGNQLLRGLQRRRARQRRCEISVHEAAFGDEFTRLDREGTLPTAIRGARTAEVLNWRFREDPLHRYTVLVARLRGELKGFIVLRITEGDMEIVDLLTPHGDAVLLELLDAAITLARERGAEVVRLQAGEESGLEPLLARAWFRFRSYGAAVVPYARPESAEARMLAEGRWQLVHADVLA